MGNLGNRSKSNIQTELVLEVALVLREPVEHLAGSLRVPNVGKFRLLSIFEDVVDEGRQVARPHLLPVEVPVRLGVLVCVESSVLTTEGVPARVPEPNIVACPCCDKRWSYFCVVHDPRVS